jgi:hypothetical protein
MVVFALKCCRFHVLVTITKHFANNPIPYGPSPPNRKITLASYCMNRDCPNSSGGVTGAQLSKTLDFNEGQNSNHQSLEM